MTVDRMHESQLRRHNRRLRRLELLAVGALAMLAAWLVRGAS